MKFTLAAILAFSALTVASPVDLASLVEKRGGCGAWVSSPIELDRRELIAREVACGPTKKDLASLVEKRGGCGAWVSSPIELDRRELIAREIACGPTSG